MSVLRPIFFIIAFALYSCSSAPSPAKTSDAPDWVHHTARSTDGMNMEYVATGEDRAPENAIFKSQAMALQDLQNECSLIPKNTFVDPLHFQQQIGVIYRAFTRIQVSIQECEQAKNPLSHDQLEQLSNGQLTSAVESYQKSYDPPEAEENAPISDKLLAMGIHDSAHLFILREQVALTQQNAMLSKNAVSLSENVAKAKVMILDFERKNPADQGFSVSRPNWIAHQATAVRETILEREALKQEYGYTPSPLGGTGKKAPAGRGRGGRRRSPPANPQQVPDSAPSPIPTL